MNLENREISFQIENSDWIACKLLSLTSNIIENIVFYGVI